MKKGRFANLDARLPVAPAAAPESDPHLTPVRSARAARTPSREGKKGITVWVSEETLHELHKLALNEKTTLAALTIESLQMLARSRGLHPFNEGAAR